MRKLASALVILLVGWSLASASHAFGQAMSYPDEPGYEQFRSSERRTLRGLAGGPSRALAFRLLMCQRRLREAQLMIAKGKVQLAAQPLKDYQETVEGITTLLKTSRLEPEELAGYHQSLEAARLHHQELLKRLTKRTAAPDLKPSLQAALASSARLRLLGLESPENLSGSPSSATTGRSRATLLSPVPPTEGALEEHQPVSPLAPAGTSPEEILLPPETPQPRSPEDVLGRRLRPNRPHPRGTRRPDDPHPRPRAREPIRSHER